MGLIQEFFDALDKLRFFNVVHEYEQGLYYRNGSSIERRIRRLPAKDLEKIVAEEKSMRKMHGTVKYVIPFVRPKLPDGYKRSFWSGLPLHPDRFSKILRSGVYFYIPLFEDIRKEFKQERIQNLKWIAVIAPAEELPPQSATQQDAQVHSEKQQYQKDIVMAVSCNIRYELMNFHKAYTQVHEYEKSLEDHGLSILARHCRGKPYSTYKDPNKMEALEKAVMDELREVATEKWGLKIHKLYITDAVPCRIERIVHEGTAVSVTNNNAPSPTSLI